jgi:sugar lactone lactonase YvrE
VTATAQFPAGLTLDVAGNLWVAEAPAEGTLGGKVEVFSPAGIKLGEIAVAGTRPTGIAFGGGANDQVFITGESGSDGAGAAGVFRYTSRCAGVR